MNHLVSCELVFGCGSEHMYLNACYTCFVWFKALDSSKIVGTIFLDFSKAFDLVDHSILLSKIAMYKTSDRTMVWLRSYLDERFQSCSVCGSLSDRLCLYPRAYLKDLSWDQWSSPSMLMTSCCMSPTWMLRVTPMTQPFGQLAVAQALCKIPCNLPLKERVTGLI